MTLLIIGSTAMSKLVPGSREPKDLDVFSDLTPSALDKDGKVDVFWDPSFHDYWARGLHREATLDELYTIKISHSYWVLPNGSWDKHMSDCVALKKAGAQLIPELHSLLYKVWETKHGKKRVNLNQEADEFFSDAVERIYLHDSIHYSVAYGDHPMYERVLADGKTVAMNMADIKAMSFEDQVKLYREEVYATALERWVIPSDYTFSPRKAYAWALKKTQTSLTKGWSATFLATNHEIFRVPDMDYVAHHLSRKDRLIPLEGK